MKMIEHPLIARPRRLWRRFTLWLRGKMPKGLFARSLMIVVLPMLLLQTAVAYFFMERHWQAVTHRLSAMVVEDVAALIDIYENYPQDKDNDKLARVAERMGLTATVAPRGPLPATLPKPFFSL